MATNNEDEVFKPNVGYSASQAAERSGFSSKTIRREIRKGNLTAYKLDDGREYRLRGSVLNAWLAGCETSK